jgi:hypothetical protein
MKETFDSVLNSVKDRFTNPFLGTFLFVWIIRNWYLVYAIFAFDKECTIDDKLGYIKNYFKDYNVFLEFFYNTCWAVGLLIVIYLILIGIQYLMRSYQLFITKINAYFDKIPVESKEHYLLLNTSFKSLSDKYKALSESHDQRITELEMLKSEIINLKNDNKKAQDKYVFTLREYWKAYAKDCLITDKKIFNDVNLSKSDNLQIPNNIREDAIYSSIIKVNSTNVINLLEYYYLKSILNTGNISEQKRKEERFNTIGNSDLVTYSYFHGINKEKLTNLELIEYNFEDVITPLGVEVAKKIFYWT